MTGADTAPDTPTEPLDARPLVRVIAGRPTEDELAAVQVVLAAVLAEQASAGVPRLKPRADDWGRSVRLMRGTLSPGTGAWGSSRGVRSG